MKHTKWIMVALLIISCLCMLPISAFADVGGICAESVDNFDHSYSLSGNGADDMIAVARAQWNSPKNGVGYGYHKVYNADSGTYYPAWCAAFINDCAFLAGQADAIPFISGQTHECGGLRRAVLDRGGVVVSNPQAGDLVFYFSSGENRYFHVGLMIDSNVSIQGNLNDTVTKINTVWEVNGTYSVSYVRPNYKTTNNPPTGGFNGVESAGLGAIRVYGWAKDPDTPDKPIAVHIYVGGSVGSGAPSYLVMADKYRSDVGNCAFDEVIPVAPTGTRQIYAYAIDSEGSGNNPMLNGSPRTVTISTNTLPTGTLESASAGVGVVHVKGWAKDDDVQGESIPVHVYVGGDVGSGAPSYAAIADKYRADLGGNYGFDITVPAKNAGNQQVYVYAINQPSPSVNNSFIGSATVNVQSDNENPVISNVQVTDVSWKGYTVTCDVSDNVAIDRVVFPSWTEDKGQDDLMADWEHNAKGTVKDGKATYRVDINAHSRQTGCYYRTHIYAYDMMGNYVCVNDTDNACLRVQLPSAITNVEVSNITSTGYTVECDIDPEWQTTRVEFPSWSVPNDGDDVIWHQGILNGNHAICTIRTEDHNYEAGCDYITHIYAIDNNGYSPRVDQNSFSNLRVSVPPVMSETMERTLLDGDYLIVSAATTDKRSFYYLDIYGIDVPAADDTNVKLYGPEEELPACDIWTIKYSNGFYTIRQKGTNMALDANYTGSNVKVHTTNGSNMQQWAICRNGNNGYRIQAKCNGLALDVQGGEAVDGANIILHTVHDNANQTWLFIPYEPSQPLPNGRYIITTDVDQSRMIDLPGDTGELEDQTGLCIRNVTQQTRYNSFDITRLDNGYYSITHVASGKAVEVYGGESDYKKQVSLHTPNGTIAQQWSITKNGSNGNYVFTVKSSGYCMDLLDASTTNGSPIVQNPYNGSPSQTWHVIPAEYVVSYDANGGTGRPGNQTKYYLDSLTLSSVVPYREGYIFRGWNTKSDGKGLGFKPGDVYEQEGDMTLYAQWTVIGKVLKLPANLTRVGVEAFAGIKASVVHIPEGCTTIASGAFRNCPNLEAVYIPSTVTSIADDAFTGSDKVIIYAKSGSEAARFAREKSITYTIY